MMLEVNVLKYFVFAFWLLMERLIKVIIPVKVFVKNEKLLLIDAQNKTLDEWKFIHGLPHS
jgi:hypothetical protein